MKCWFNVCVLPHCACDCVCLQGTFYATNLATGEKWEEEGEWGAAAGWVVVCGL